MIKAVVTGHSRGLGAAVAEGIKQVDYKGFVELVAAQPRVQSWL